MFTFQCYADASYTAMQHCARIIKCHSDLQSPGMHIQLSAKLLRFSAHINLCREVMHAEAAGWDAVVIAA